MPRKFDRSLIPPAPNLEFEQVLWKDGVEYLAGIDEAGRGALAGPVAVGAVVLPNQKEILEILKGVKDSKQLTAKAREALADIICDAAISFAVGYSEAKEIDKMGIAPAVRLAAVRALKLLEPPPQHLLIDYFPLPEAELPETVLVKGDARSLSIACASILAKVHRDRLMLELDTKYPEYGFASHKGYGTAKHRAAIQKHGGCRIHRRTFSPFRVEEG